MTDEEAVARMFAKLKLNSELPLVGNDRFVFYDPQLAETITATGQEIMREMDERLRNSND